MIKIAIYPYKLHSSSTKLLQNQLDFKWVKRISGFGKFKPKKTDIVINWGNSNTPVFGNLGIINDPNAVAIAINKIDTFRMFDIHGIKCPEWTTEHEKAIEWINQGSTVLQRSSVTSHGGNHITILNDTSLCTQAPLYVKYKKKKKEFRVHVFKEKVIDVTEKKKRNGFNSLPNANTYIRSHNNGWVFCRQNIQEPTEMRELAIKAIKAVGLDFGAVDIIWNEFENICYVLEINTAPGLDNTTASKYKEAITNYVHNNSI